MVVMVVDWTENCLKFNLYFISGFNKLTMHLPLMMKTTRSSEMPALRAIEAGNNKVVGSGSG